MDDFRVIVDSSSLNVSQSGSIAGQIWMEFNRHAFPEAGWNDFALVVLGWWGESIAEALRVPGKDADLRFMDGPFHVRISSDDGEQVRLLTFSDRGREAAAFECDARQMRHEVAAAAQTVLGFCGKHGLESDDVQNLRRAISALTDLQAD